MERTLSNSRPVVATVDTAALRHNARRIRQLAPGCSIYAAVKANGYGHGAQLVTQALANSVDGFAVIEIELAVALRRSGFTGPILVLEGLYEFVDVETFVAHDLEAVVHCIEQVDWVARYRGMSLKVWLKVDTGMNRLGIPASHFDTMLARLRSSPGVTLCGVMSHLAHVDNHSSVDQQIRRFKALQIPPEMPRSLASSGAVMRYPTTHLDWVRPGLMLYGISPLLDSTGADWGLRPVMTFASRVISLREIMPGESIGYGETFVAVRPMRVANVAGGYADGYPQSAPSGTPVLVDGVPSRTLGRVSMDKLCVDVSHILTVKVGTEVIFWGAQLPIERVAKAAGGSPYELLSHIAGRVRLESV
ncbi:alanine racemase [Pseudomonas sp. MWU16-30317]|uniref:alanine racemase n=1 Tax=Pseudomonas sp. MWU16-30317 TaxID=2878095 RepID=UPI001CFB4D52|nr:alanine racemase [Pseudomonas sp. MWU16-30317]